MVRRGTLLLGIAVATMTPIGCSSRSASKQTATQLEASMDTNWDAKGKVEAVGIDGALIVQRGETIDVYAPNGDLLGALPIGNPSDTPGYWYAISPGATLVAFTARDGMIELWDVSKQRRTSRMSAAAALNNGRTLMPMVGASPVAPVSWGPPRFLSDGRLVTHHDGGLVIWKPDGTVAGAVVDETFGIVRDSRQLSDPDRLQVRCGSNFPGVANTAEFVVSLKERRVVDRIWPDRKGLRRFDRLDVWIGYDDVQSSLWLKDGDTVHRLGTEVEPQLIAVSPNGERVAWVEQPWGEHPVIVKVLDRTAGRVLGINGDKTRLVSLRYDGTKLLSVSEQGAVRPWQIPGFENAERVELVTVKEDPRERTWQRSLVEFGLGNFDDAARMTSEFRKRGVPVKYQIGALYTLSQKAKTGAEQFIADCEALGISFSATSTQNALLVLAEDFARAQLVLGADFLIYWLDSPAPGYTQGTEQALRISSEFLLQLSEADQYDLRKSLFMRLAEDFPDHALVREELENQRQLEAD